MPHLFKKKLCPLDLIPLIAIFTRFYFSSSADLLDILSKGNQPQMVAKHLTKLFDSMAKLIMEEDGEGKATNTAHTMVAKDGEKVLFKVTFIIIIVYHVDVSPPFLAGSTTDLSLTISPSPHSAEQSDQSDQGDQRQFIGSSLIVTYNGISTRNRKLILFTSGPPWQAFPSGPRLSPGGQVHSYEVEA